jgi:hypothetical protein
VWIFLLKDESTDIGATDLRTEHLQRACQFVILGVGLASLLGFALRIPSETISPTIQMLILAFAQT